MKLAVSNIAWLKEEEEQIARLMQELGVKYVEIAPTKQWDDPTRAPKNEANAYRDWWKQYGIEVVAFQSMLFARPDLKLFEGPKLRQEAKAYLENFIRLAGTMGAKRMVFGSPKNRQKDDLSDEDAMVVATDFFSSLGNTAAANDVVFCIEPNAPQYGCNFITTAGQGIDLVNAVNNPGFKLHLDIACMTLAGDDIASSIMKAAPVLEHFHISSPMLEAVEERADIEHEAAATTLRAVNYKGFISIEMRPAESSNVKRVRKAVKFVQSVYGV